MDCWGGLNPDEEFADGNGVDTQADAGSGESRSGVLSSFSSKCELPRSVGTAAHNLSHGLQPKVRWAIAEDSMFEQLYGREQKKEGSKMDVCV